MDGEDALRCRYAFKLETDEGKIDEAERSYRNAIDVARKQGSKSYELRSTIRLCRIWNQQNRTDEARRSLSEIYGWFTEGFETTDLIEAKQILDERA